jgi:peptidoglycan hydrolase-like protein with peptidoglycan-binding domain
MVSGAGGAASGLGRAVFRNPKPTFYGSIFIVAFSFVAANALWYQPKNGHLSPFLATRDARDPNAIAGYRPFRQADPADVTTFRIERAPVPGQQSQGQPSQGQQQSQHAPIRQADNQPYTGLPASTPAAQKPVAPPVDDIRSIIAGQNPPGADPSAVDPTVVASIQRALAGRGLYDGAADGLMGPRTQAAIIGFEQASGLPQHGAPTPQLLAALQSAQRLPQNQSQPQSPANATPLPVPRQAPRQEMPRAETQRDTQRNDARPVAVSSRQSVPNAAQPAVDRSKAQPVASAVRNEDPITAAIRSADRQPAMRPPADIPGAPRATVTPVSKRSDTTALPNSMVLQIQKGLSNIAYTDVELNGVAGTQTKIAIRRFQKHYRLPETGEPDQLVLNKLKAIGAL